MKTLLLILVLVAAGCSKPIDRHFQDKMIGRWRKVEKPYDTLSIIRGDSNKLYVKYQGLDFPAASDTIRQVLRLNAGADVINLNLSLIDGAKLKLAGDGEFERIVGKE